MKQAIRIDNVDLAFELREARRLVQETACDESGVTDYASVAEQVITQFDEIGFDVKAIQGLGWNAIEGQLAELLPETAAGVQQRLISLR